MGCSISSWGPLHRRQRWGSLHWGVVCSRLQQFWHWVTGGRSWKAHTGQCLPNAARDLWLRMRRAEGSSDSANTREDFVVVLSSSIVRSQRGLDTMSSWNLAYWGLHAKSSAWMDSGVWVMCPLPMEREPVLTPSTWILYHFLSSCSETSLFPPKREMLGDRSTACLMRSLVVWSALVESIRLPWLLKLAATILRCLEEGLAESMAFSLGMMEHGSGLLSGGTPLGRNWATSLEGW